jgi:hypothetical protein
MEISGFARESGGAWPNVAPGVVEIRQKTILATFSDFKARKNPSPIDYSLLRTLVSRVA